ncbi:MAG: hypothetical protein IGS48_19470 [Oscillatoriales cyanobacterium C42_A2020_001]|nr:hypothetical protein [Leptolyngbyaceae cyanobacterium C42_A2020_001]
MFRTVSAHVSDRSFPDATATGIPEWGEVRMGEGGKSDKQNKFFNMSGILSLKIDSHTVDKQMLHPVVL